MLKYLSPSAGVAMATLALCLSAWWGLARANDDQGSRSRQEAPATGDESREHDAYDRILKSVREGKILPLARLKAIALERWPGEFVRVTVDTEKDEVVYEFRILRPNGRLTEVEINAADGKVLEVENE